MNDYPYGRHCPKCKVASSKYYYFGMSFYWKCFNEKCSVLDIDYPEEKKPGWVEPEDKLDYTLKIGDSETKAKESVEISIDDLFGDEDPWQP